MNAWMIFDLAVLAYWVGVAILIISEDREPTEASPGCSFSSRCRSSG